MSVQDKIGRGARTNLLDERIDPYQSIGGSRGYEAGDAKPGKDGTLHNFSANGGWQYCCSLDFFLLRCHPERSRFSGEAKDLSLIQPGA
jgi:hypothetical protein